MNIQPLRHGLARLHRRLEFNLASYTNRVLSKAIRESPDHSNATDLSITKQQHFERDNSLHADSSCFACITRQLFRSDLSFNVNFLDFISRDLIAIEKMRERAVVSATIILVLIGGHRGLRRQRRSWRRLCVRCWSWRRRGRWEIASAGLSERGSANEDDED